MALANTHVMPLCATCMSSAHAAHAGFSSRCLVHARHNGFPAPFASSTCTCGTFHCTQVHPARVATAFQAAGRLSLAAVADGAATPAQTLGAQRPQADEGWWRGRLATGTNASASALGGASRCSSSMTASRLGVMRRGDCDGSYGLALK